MCLRHGCGVEYIQLLIDFGANVYLPTLIIEKSTKQNEAVELLLQERGNAGVMLLINVGILLLISGSAFIDIKQASVFFFFVELLLDSTIQYSTALLTEQHLTILIDY